MEALKLLIDKLSQYNFLTNILPGTVLCLLMKYVVGYDFFVIEDWYLMGILFYLAGMVNNRFGSLIVEPFLKWIHFIKKAPYKNFIVAEKIDEKVTTLSMENNVFRSYISALALTLLAMAYKEWLSSLITNQSISSSLLLTALLILFAFSYRKQSRYVKERVEKNIKSNSSAH